LQWILQAIFYVLWRTRFATDQFKDFGSDVTQDAFKSNFIRPTGLKSDKNYLLINGGDQQPRSQVYLLNLANSTLKQLSHEQRYDSSALPGALMAKSFTFTR